MNPCWSRWLLLGLVATLALSGDLFAQSGSRKGRYVRRPGASAAETPAPTAPLTRIDLSRPRVALEGADAVKLRVDGARIAGIDQHVAEFDGQRYLFASLENKKRFDADPGAFAPALGGMCPVSLIDDHKLAKGLIEHALIQNDRIFLFASAEAKGRFTASPERYQDADLALAGFSPVSLMDNGERRLGDSKFRVWFEGRRFHLVDAGERERFLADPARYFPAMAGLDPIEAAKGRVVPGRPEHAMLYKSRLFLLASEESQSKFLQDPTTVADLDVANQGRCPVSEVDEKRSVPGKLDVAAIVDGQRYLFASERHRERFLKHPDRYVADDDASTPNG